MRKQPVLCGACGLLAAVATACQVPAEPSSSPVTAAADRLQEPTTAQEAFAAWADSLPAESRMPPMTMEMAFAMTGDVQDFAGTDFAFDGESHPEPMSFSMSMKFSGELQDWWHFRARMDVSMDMAPLREQSGGRPTVVGMNFVGDGEVLWIEPDWSQAWFIEDLRREGAGIESMVFSVQADTLRELMDTMPLIVPEEQREMMGRFFECASNPACLARLTASSMRILSFERGPDRILAEMEMDPDVWGSVINLTENPMTSMFGESAYRFRSEFDAATGAVIRTEQNLAATDGSMTMRYVARIADAPFPADLFHYTVPPGRNVFPVDVFMKPVIAGLRNQAGLTDDPGEDDFKF
jgi:hypothetical protein